MLPYQAIPKSVLNRKTWGHLNLKYLHIPLGCLQFHNSCLTYLFFNLTQEDLCTPGISSGVSILAVNMATIGFPSANDGTSRSIIFSDASRVPSYFTIPIYFYSSTVGMSWRSTSSGSVSVPANIWFRSVPGSVSSMFGNSVYPSSTPFISSSHIGRFLQSSNYRSLILPCPSLFTCAITVSWIGVS